MSLSERQLESVQRLIDRRLQEREAPERPEAAPVSSTTKLTASVLLALVSPASLLPIVAGAALLAGLLVKATGIASGWAAVFLLVMFTAVAYWSINAVIAAERPHPLIDNRRWWPLFATSLGVLLTGYELASGGDVDLVIFAWVPVGLWWSWCLLMSLNSWHGLKVARWFLLPICVATIASARVTEGFFTFRFDASIDELTKAATANPHVSSGDYGSFTILLRRRVDGCEAAFKITGWWVDDDRTVAYCPQGPPAGFYEPHSLGHDWYEIGFYTQ